jgi:hypothetical protein
MRAITLVLRLARTATVRLRSLAGRLTSVAGRLTSLAGRLTSLAGRLRVPAWARPWLAVAKRVACVGIVVIAGVTLWNKVNHDRHFTAGVIRPASVRRGIWEDNQRECLYRAIRAAVPEGSRVDVSGVSNPVYIQDITELSTDWAVMQLTARGAQWKVFVYRTHGDCSGLSVAVQHP